MVERHLAKVNVARSNRVARFHPFVILCIFLTAPYLVPRTVPLCLALFFIFSHDNIASKKYLLEFLELDHSPKIKL